MEAVEKLDALGYCVLELPSSLFKKFDVHKFLREQLEFVQPETTPIKVLGGFGAFGNPCSFHNKRIRTLRNGIYNHMRVFFEHAFPGQYMQCVPDRFSLRREGTSTSPESWHQDVSVPIDTGTVFGGWVNLDADETQFFSCIPGTHKTFPPTSTGFAKFSKEQSAVFDKARMKPGIAIPPRHCIVFNELLVHEVTATTQQHDSYRLYLKYLITDEKKTPFGDEIMVAMNDFGVPPHHVCSKKRGREHFGYPTMYGPSHVNFNNRYAFKIEDFTSTIKPEFHAPARTKGVNAGKVWVEQVMPSLKSVGMQSRTVPAYEAHELAWFGPQLLVPHDGGNSVASAERNYHSDLHGDGHTPVC